MVDVEELAFASCGDFSALNSGCAIFCVAVSGAVCWCFGSVGMGIGGPERRDTVDGQLWRLSRRHMSGQFVNKYLTNSFFKGPSSISSFYRN